MEIKDMLAFVAVVEYGSYTKASVATFVSQPSLSKSIQRLESLLDIELLRRSTRLLELTDAGDIVYHQILKIVRNIDDMQHQLHDLKNTQRGKLKVGMPPLLAALYFMGISELFHHEYPDIEVELMEYEAKEILQFVDTDKVDLAIVMLPVDEKKYDITPFMTEEFGVYVDKNHPLAHHKSLTVAALANEKFVMIAENYALHNVIVELCRKNGFSPNIVYKSSQWNLLVELVASKRGISILPIIVNDKQVNDQVVVIPFENNTAPWELVTITKKNMYQSFAVRSFLQISQSFLHSLPRVLNV
ncbi:LysR family transcriptional regulator [Kurthia sibirica]|uniref:LysR family transcriptional regulator n=1 Tax=Kurthia sibirica TaxID=202750 RepID=A0A2U3AFE8_9BACL|nr:LysR family transcriptional regulator [Kurthia sibirica]PWI23250.1 LysR family transcriptional regulator [Kurthia sibirica]GEK35539.1 putative HTH-type transcriptional regulator YwbI [Kurthia sibirica]